MLTAVIRAPGSAQALAATFAVLIPAVAEGFLGHAVVVDIAGTGELERIAEATGARYLRADAAESWRRGAERARGDRLLLLDAGDLPQRHWVEAIERHLLVAPDAPALLPAQGFADSWRERVAVALRGRELRAGLIATRSAVLAGRLEAAPCRLPAAREMARP